MIRTSGRRPLLLCLAIVVGAILAVGCGDDSDSSGDTSADLNVVATLPLFADIAANVAGDRIAIDSLLPPGADPHTFEPSPSDTRKIAEADVIFANGLGLEPSLLRAIGANISSDAVLVELAEASIAAGVTTLPGSGSTDPHLWMDAEIGGQYAAIIRDTLSLADPAGSETYSANYDAYATLLDETVQYVADTTAGVPAERRQIVSTHDAFGYLARAIDFEVAGFVASGPGQDASPEDISALVATIEDLGIPAVFTEPQTSVETRVLEQIAADVGAEVCTLYSAALDDTVRTYVELLRFDAEELARCLGASSG